VFGDKDPKSDQVTTDLVGEKLPHPAFQAGRITRFGFGPFFGAMGVDRCFRLRRIAVKFFFVGQSLRSRARHFAY
jgi:hypothetical protein